jgi:hypothetical protein
MLVSVHAVSSISVRDVAISVDTSRAVGQVDPAFLSVTMDGHTFDGGTEMPFWKPGSNLTRILAAELAPAYIRFGGNSHSHLTYNMTDKPLPPNPAPKPSLYPPPDPTECMSREQWDAILEFGRGTGWRVVFALNALMRVKDDAGMYSIRGVQLLILTAVAYIATHRRPFCAWF